MKFCLNGRQQSSYLKKADEIWIEYRDRKAIPDYAEKYPQAALVLEVPPATQWEFDEIKEYFILSRNRLTLCIPDIRGPHTLQLKEAGIPFFWGYEVCTAYELQAMKNLGVSYVRVGAPLFFQTDILKKAGIPVRVTANTAHDGYLPHTDGVNGTWIRPEDVKTYEGIVTTIDFADCDNSKEQALYRIYAEQHHWPGKLDMIISNLGAAPTNRMLPPELAEHRLNCGQKCAGGRPCRLCYRYFSLADPDKIRNYLENVNNT